MSNNSDIISIKIAVTLLRLFLWWAGMDSASRVGKTIQRDCFNLHANLPAGIFAFGNLLFESIIITKIAVTLLRLFLWWAGMDSNHRTRMRTDLQSAAFSHSATYPYIWCVLN